MFTFCASEGLTAMTWCLRFGSGSFSDWKDKFTIYLWEGKNHISYGKAKADEQRYIQEAYEDVEMGEPEGENEDDNGEQDEEEEEGGGPASIDDQDSSDSDTFARGSKNEQLAVGYKNDLSFVTRGNMIGVFAHKDDKIRFRTAIDRVKDLSGKTLTPQKVREEPR
jgi:hypothetical protein